MKKILTIIILTFCSFCYGQRQDSLPTIPDTTFRTIVMEALNSLSDKVTHAQYMQAQEFYNFLYIEGLKRKRIKK